MNLTKLTVFHLLLAISVLLCSQIIDAQTIISGTVKQKNGSPIYGANIYIDGAYDGATSGEDGKFNFTTSENGVQTLVISFVSFETYIMAADVTQMKDLKVILKDDVNSLETVVISAGSFSAGDNSKVSVLKPLDVVTTASALGDFVGALQTLPGTTTVAEDGRLFVRGGEAEETQIFIDGLRVFTPYTPTTNNTPTRGRYSPFLFDGITFSTGGYSAEFGQALSSVLLLNTIDEPDQEKTEIAIMTVGVGLGNTQKFTPKKESNFNQGSSISVNATYINLAPYIALFPDRNDWQKPFETFSGETVYRQKMYNGLLKVYAAFDNTNFQLTQEDINLPEGFNFKLNNSNFYTNANYTASLENDWKIFAGASYTIGKNKLGLQKDNLENTENSAHFKLKARKKFSNRVKLSVGVEQFSTDFDETFAATEFISDYGYVNNITAAYVEADFIFSQKLALKAGIREEYSALFNQFTFSPRLSFAYKTGKNSQVSLAYGDFYQQPNSDILKFNSNLEAQKTQHCIFNYQYSANNRILRAEAYYKDYKNLVTFSNSLPTFGDNFNNGGNGYATGLDIFWRDNESIKNVDYWVSYSYLDTERFYRNYPKQAAPPFANTHNISVIGKYWIDDWKSQIGFSYQYASGRTYTDLNIQGFLNSKTKDFNSVSLNWAYLLSQQKILYFSVNNPFGFKNINGYQYADAADANGNFNRRSLRPAADQFFFIGFFWTISEKGTDNQLNNL